MSKLDQFYTNPWVAKDCYNILQKFININEYDKLLEPSAGTGSFYNLLDNDKRIGIDIDPKNYEIHLKAHDLRKEKGLFELTTYTILEASLNIYEYEDS